MYNLLKFVHVVSVIVWVGSSFAMFLLHMRLAKSGAQAAVEAVFMQGKFFSMGVYMPAAIITLITGIGMVQTGPWTFGTFWVQTGTTLLILSMIIGGGVSGATARKIASGAGDPVALRKRLLTSVIVNLLILFSTVFVMVVKP